LRCTATGRLQVALFFVTTMLHQWKFLIALRIFDKIFKLALGVFTGIRIFRCFQIYFTAVFGKNPDQHYYMLY